MMVKALVVDDEEDLCEGLKEMLEFLDVSVECAVSGERALELARQHDFKLCIIDLKLSTAISGLDLIRMIRKEKPLTLIIAMSGYIDLVLRQQAEDCHIDDYLEKPNDLRQDVFTSKVKNLLAKR